MLVVTIAGCIPCRSSNRDEGNDMAKKMIKRPSMAAAARSAKRIKDASHPPRIVRTRWSRDGVKRVEMSDGEIVLSFPRSV